jgi:hypothetical protein
MDDYEALSEEAKRAWQRGFDLAYPRSGPRWWAQPEDRSTDEPRNGIERAAEVVVAALEGLGGDRGEAAPFGASAPSVRLVVMDPVSVEAVIVEFDKLKSDECRDALGKGFLRGMLAKARAARAAGPNQDTPRLN